MRAADASIAVIVAAVSVLPRKRALWIDESPGRSLSRPFSASAYALSALRPKISRLAKQSQFLLAFTMASILRANSRGRASNFIDENGGGVGVRLRKHMRSKPAK